MKHIKYVLIIVLLHSLLLTNITIAATTAPLPFPINKDKDYWQETKNYPAILKGTEIKCSFPDKQWWIEFNDPILSSYIDQAISANQDINIAIARIEEANAQANVIFGREFPQITLRDIFLRTKGSQTFLIPNAAALQSASLLAGGTQNLYILPLIAQWELDIFRTNRLRTRAARKATDAARFNLNSILITITSSVATAYFNLLQNDKLLKLQNALLINQERSLELRQALYNEGQIEYDEILANQETISNIKSNISEIQRLQGLLVHQLCILMGKPPVSESDFTRNNLDCFTVNKEIKIGTPSQLIVRRPDILSSEALLQQAGINVSVARRSFLPTITAIGSFGYATADLRKFFDWNSNTTAVGASIAQPIFAGGSIIANLGLNKALYKEAIQNYQKTILNAFKDVEDALSTLNTNITQYINAESDVVNSEQQVSLTGNRFLEGTNSCLDVLNSEQQLLNFQQNYTQKKAVILVDNINLYRALGGGF